MCSEHGAGREKASENDEFSLENEMRDSRQKHEAKEGQLTARQREYYDAYRQHGSTRGAANVMGVSIDTAREQLRNVAHKLGLSAIKDMLANTKNRTRANAAELMRLVKRQSECIDGVDVCRCALSGVEITPADAQLDHIVPRSAGGSDAIDNLQWVSKEVNAAKGTMTQEAFIAMCVRVAQWCR